MDLVQRLIASSCSENCLMGKAAKEITRLRKIEAAALKEPDPVICSRCGVHKFAACNCTQPDAAEDELREEVRKWSDRYYSLWSNVGIVNDCTFTDWAAEVNEMYREEE